MIVGLDDAPDVVAVVPTLGGALPRLQACLDSLAASDFTGRLAVVVVWNDPRRPLPSLPPPGRMTVLEPGLNLGFPGALNHARSRVHADFLWVLQDDVVVGPECLARLRERMAADDRPAVVSPVTVTAQGVIPARSRGGVLDADGGMAYWYPTEDTAPADLDVDHRLDWVASSGTLARLTAWDAVGGFDPAFFPLQWSDVDFGYRLGRVGFRSVLEPAARIRHEVGGSTPGVMAQYLGHTQPARFRRKNFMDEQALPDDLVADPLLVARVAQSASLGFVDLATFAASLLRDRDHEIGVLRANAAERDGQLVAQHDQRAAFDGELARMRSTWSWRLTAPLRRIRRFSRR